MSLSPVAEFNSLNAAYSRDVLRTSRASELALFLYDVSDEGPSIRFLYNTGIAPELVTVYRQSVFRDDPLLPHGGASDKLLGVRELGMSHLPAKQFSASGTYYTHALRGAGYIETAALSRQLSRRFYLVAGMLLGQGARQSRHIYAESAVDKTQNWLLSAADHMIDSGILSSWRESESSKSACPLADIPERHLLVLTPREKDVLAEMLRGFSNKQISACLGLSEYTIENHLRRIYKKFAVHSRTALIATLSH
ncbi:MAG: LuxR family transcriptional regulator [Zhongshania sp.]|uniref:helix-turn-helix transcriptional regulator n=1 Tax=Zhongshania sp. TaxID=1971902 RepID=UPI0026196F79|nr:LuxR family transcriptional regulator [Zhongshania sp.]MDF1690823.1 LuxR family transcriptional regulator [Zhongshania sp.]